MVATDSYRLAITDAPLEETAADEFQAVISGSFLSEIASLPKTESPVSLALADNQIVVTCADTVFIKIQEVLRLQGTENTGLQRREHLQVHLIRGDRRLSSRPMTLI